jgi:FkbM family methyltransferase
MALADALLAGVGPAQRRVVTETPLGVRLWLDPLNRLGMSLAQGPFEEPVVQALEKYLGPGAVFLDVGANEGIHSVYAARLVGAAGTVLAVEPQSRLQAVIDRNFALNGLRNYRLWACALSDHDDATLALNLYPGLNTGSSSVVARYRFCRSSERVRTKTGTALIGESGVDRVDLVKVDVEGYEPEVVRGLLPALRERRIQALMVDYHGAILGRRALDAEDTHRRVLQAGMLCPVPGDLSGYVTYVLP